MGKNKIASGDSIMIAIPDAGCSSGGQMVNTVATPGVPLLVGDDLVGVPTGTYEAGTSGNMTLALEGVFGNQLLKTDDAPAVGDKLYLDSANGYLTVTSAGNVWAGWCYDPATVVGEHTVCSILLKKG